MKRVEERMEEVRRWKSLGLARVYGKYVYEMNSLVLVCELMDIVEEQLTRSEFKKVFTRKLVFERLIKDRFGNNCLEEEVVKNE